MFFSPFTESSHKQNFDPFIKFIKTLRSNPYESCVDRIKYNKKSKWHVSLQKTSEKILIWIVSLYELFEASIDFQWRDRNLSGFIKNIYVSEMKESLSLRTR